MKGKDCNRRILDLTLCFKFYQVILKLENRKPRFRGLRDRLELPVSNVHRHFEAEAHIAKLRFAPLHFNLLKLLDSGQAASPGEILSLGVCLQPEIPCLLSSTAFCFTSEQSPIAAHDYHEFGGDELPNRAVCTNL
jgi:hypothetical protein